MINVLDSSLLTSKMHENNSDINTYNQMQERKKEKNTSNTKCQFCRPRRKWEQQLKFLSKKAICL